MTNTTVVRKDETNRTLQDVVTIGWNADNKFDRLGKTYFFKELFQPFEDMPDYFEAGKRVDMGDALLQDKYTLMTYMMFELDKSKHYALWIEWENGETTPFMDRVL